MDNKDQFDSYGKAGDSSSKKDYSDMSVDDLLNVLSGGTPSAESAPPAEETSAYEPSYDSYDPDEDLSAYSSYDPDEDLSAYSSYDPDEDLSAYSSYDPDEDVTVYEPSGFAPAENEPVPPPAAALYSDPTPAAPAPEPEKPKPKKLKKAEKKAPAEEKKQEAKPAEEDKKSLLRRILDEDPDELLNTRREDPEKGSTQSGGNIRRTIYAAAGLIFSLLACVGLVSLIILGSRFFGTYSSGDTGKKAMRKVIYPAVIMDIPSFNKPSELSSNQIITAAIWSLVMDKDAVNKYQRTFDVITVPAVDVESYAAKLFGSDLPAFEHGNAGPSEARFYYSEENKSYNIPVRPVTFTYSPRIKSVSRSGSEYTLEVEYLEELPEWVDESVAKTVRYILADTNDGYQIKSMQVLSQQNSMV
ncbi:MAG: hypothetical protein J5501_05910 [Ruminococcus sp.]|nr:hypothetical protein [Ruminococcus sp.]